MKIGILTYFEGANFGMNLQAFASSSYFSNLGHEVWILNYAKDKEEYDYSYCHEKQIVAHKVFIHNRLHLTNRISQNELYSHIIENKYDVIAFGSDAIWNKRDRTNLYVYSAQWLNDKRALIEKGVKFICLSPAFMGSSYSDLSEEEKLSFNHGIRNFTHVNVRDTMTRNIVNRDIMGENYIKTLNPDPAFMLNRFCVDKWDNIDINIKPKSYYIITLPTNYGLRESMTKWLKLLKNELNNRGYKLVELPLPEGPCMSKIFDFVVPYPIDPLQWFLWLKNSKGFIGMRFHAVVSCISSGTPFYSLDIYGNISKLIFYLNYLGFHKLDRHLNKGSKIRNLIEGSGLESYRMNGVYVNRLSPKKLINKLENFNLELLTKFRDKNIQLFEENMMTAIS